MQHFRLPLAAMRYLASGLRAAARIPSSSKGEVIEWMTKGFEVSSEVWVSQMLIEVFLSAVTRKRRARSASNAIISYD